MQNRVPLKAVQAFEAAARLSSFALAAEELFVTPSAVSHQIKLLEEQFGIALFHRVHRAVVLTDAGRRYAEEVSGAFARIDQATRELGRTAKSDILTVHSAPSFATQWLMPRLARFSSLNPDVDLRLNASADPVNLLLETVDIDIRYGMRRLQPPGTMVLTFPAEPIVPMCAPELMQSANPVRSTPSTTSFRWPRDAHARRDACLMSSVAKGN
jgi:LysR family glycine cleavage system transcriptional activator